MQEETSTVEAKAITGDQVCRSQGQSSKWKENFRQSWKKKSTFCKSSKKVEKKSKVEEESEGEGEGEKEKQMSKEGGGGDKEEEKASSSKAQSKKAATPPINSQYEVPVLSKGEIFSVQGYFCKIYIVS